MSYEPRYRFGSHLYAAARGDETRLYHAIRKHGAENFVLSVISEHESEEEAFAAEHHLVIEWHTHLDGYNMNEGGEGGTAPDEATRRKKSASAKGRVQTDETRRKISETRKARKIPSPAKSEDGIRRIIEANAGVKRDPSVGKNIAKRAAERKALGLKRKSVSDEVREQARIRQKKFWETKRQLVKKEDAVLESSQQEELQAQEEP